MPNICLASAVVRGYYSHVDEFMKIMKADYNYHKLEFSHTPHFYRIFYVYEEEPEYYGIEKIQPFSFECAWSVHSCCFDGPFSYYYDATRMPDQPGSLDEETKKRFPWHTRKKSQKEIRNEMISAAYHIINSSHILYEANRLGLYIEIISTEPGMGFSEHYLINQGVLVIDEENEYREYCIDDLPTVADFKKEYGISPNMTEEQYKDYYNNNPYIIINEDDYYIDDDNPIYKNIPIVKNVLCKVVNQDYDHNIFNYKDYDYKLVSFLRKNKEIERYYALKIQNGELTIDEAIELIKQNHITYY